MAIKVICVVILATLAYVNCECSSESLRQFAIDACHITKRSAHFKSSHFKNEGYDVEHVIPKYRSRHSKPSHAKKLTRDDFPSGAYLLLHPATSRHISYENDIVEKADYDDSDENYLANEILTMDMELNRDRHHKHKHTYRFKRSTAAEILIEHCCSQASADVCGKYFCH